MTNFNGKRRAEYTFSQEGTLVYVPSRQLQRTLVWVDRKGAAERIPFPPGGYEEVALSPDGGRLAAMTIEKGERMALLFGDLARGTLSRSTAEGRFRGLAWAPDGKRVAFGFAPAGRGAAASVYWQSADGSTPPERLTSETDLQQEVAEFLLTRRQPSALRRVQLRRHQSGQYGLGHLRSSAQRERTLRPFLQTKFCEG